jgi:TPR repeat protein
VLVDYAKAREWYEKGAAAGNGPSMGNLGALYSRGWGAGLHHGAQVVRARRCGWQSYRNVQPGPDLRKGREIAVDYTAARAWYEKAAAEDYAPAMLRLGWLYEEGHGVERNLAEAARWYEQAAAQDEDEAEQAKKHLARVREALSKKD